MNSNEGNNNNNGSRKNSSIPKLIKKRIDHKSRNKTKKTNYDEIIKALFLLQVMTAMAIQNLGDNSHIGLTSKKFGNSNNSLHHEVNFDNVGNIATGLYGKEIDLNSTNNNNIERKRKLSILLSTQIDLAKKIGITTKDLKNASIAIGDIIRNHKPENKHRSNKSYLTHSNTMMYKRLSRKQSSRRRK